MEKSVGFKRKHGLVFSSGYPSGHCSSYTKGCLCIFCMDEQGQGAILDKN